MSKLGRLVLVAAVCALTATQALATDTDPNNTGDNSSLGPVGPDLLWVLTKMNVDRLNTRIADFTTRQVLAAQGVDSDRAAAIAGLGGDTGLSAGEQATGMSAGAAPGRLGVWVSGGWSSLDNDLSSTDYDGSAYNFLGGADYQFNDRFLMGLAFGYESSDVDTTFNSGNVSSDGFTLSPYAGYVLNRYFTVDVNGGYSGLSYDMRRTSGPSQVLGETDASRWFLAGNVNGYYAVDRVLLSGRLGYLYTVEGQDSYTETDGTVVAQRDLDLGQFRAGGQVAYDLGMVQPYVIGTWVYDTTQTSVSVGAGQAQPSNDRSGFDVGGGVRFSLSDRVTGGIEGTTHLGREDFDSSTVSGNLRVKF